MGAKFSRRIVTIVMVLVLCISIPMMTGCGLNKIRSNQTVGKNQSSIAQPKKVILKASANWHHQVAPTGETLNSVQFLGNSDGWVVGGGGTILHTTNGGATWILEQHMTNAALNSVYFRNTSDGVAVGERDKPDAPLGKLVILSTKNAGGRWTLSKVPRDKEYMPCGERQNTLFNAVDFAGNSGWIIGSEVATTYNAGRTWEYRRLSSAINFRGGTKEMYCSMRGVDFLNADQGWVIGSVVFFNGPKEGLIVKTANGGMSWVKEGAIDTMPPLRGIYFANASDGWVVGKGGGIFSTVDGGKQWIMQSSDNMHQLNAVYFLNQSEGWVVGNSGVILATTDGGRHWVRESSGTGANLHSVYCVDSGCWAVGSHGTILHLRVSQS